MFAFVDESGNTGQNLFDEAQPIFSTMALLTRDDFDLAKGPAMAKLCVDQGVVELHAAELGVDGIERIARPLVSILKSAQARFAFARVEKQYLLSTKIFDAVFDVGENQGAHGQIYNIRPLRLIMTFKLAEVIPPDLARDFWKAMMAKRPADATAGLVAFCDAVVRLVAGHRDRRFVQVVTDTLGWARDNPEAIYFHSTGKLARQGHMPNTVAFGNLLDGIELQSKAWGVPIQLIRHDQQNEFAGALAFWHDLYSHASPEAVDLMVGEKFVMQKGYGSRLEMADSAKSHGIQVTDVLLWLFNRASSKKPIGTEGWRLLRHALRRSHQSDFSFEGVGQALERQFGWMMEVDPPADALERAAKVLEEGEAIRRRRVAEYASSKSALLTADSASE
jgi:hypothetical protein